MTIPFNPCQTNPCQDQSVNMLTYVFGPVVSDLTTGTHSATMGASLAATLFSQFNLGVLALSVVVLLYIFIVGLVNTANDGEAFGRDWSTHHTPLRTLFGFTLLLPTGAGYSIIQTILLIVALWGVNLANKAYTAGMGFMTLNANALNNMGGNNFYGLQQFAENYLTDTYCAQAANAIYTDANGGGAPGVNRLQGGYDTTTSAGGNQTGTTYFSYRNAATLLGGGNPICGTVTMTYHYAPQSASGWSGAAGSGDQQISTAADSLRQQILSAKVGAVQSLMSNLDSYAAGFPLRQAQVGQNTITSAQLNTFVQNANNQISQTLTQNMLGGSNVTSGMQQLGQTLTQGGWAMAPGFLQRVSTVRKILAGVLSEPIAVTTTPGYTGLTADEQLAELKFLVDTYPSTVMNKAAMQSNYVQPNDLSNLNRLVPNSIRDVEPGSLMGNWGAMLNGFFTSIMQASMTVLTGVNPGSANSLGNGWLASSAGAVTAWACGAVNGGDVNGASPTPGVNSPIGASLQRMQCLGDYANSLDVIVAGTRTTIQIAFGTLTATAGLVSSVKVLGNGVDAGPEIMALDDIKNTFILPPLTAAMSMFSDVGFLYGVLIPMTPYLIFMVVVAGWFVGLVQGAILLALWALKHMTPSQSFIGSDSQLYLFLVSIFIRPVLAIIALFLGYLISDAIIDFAVKGYFGAYAAQATSGGIIGGLAQFKTFFWYIMLFGVLIEGMLLMITSLAQSLPDAILGALGGGQGFAGDIGRAMNRLNPEGLRQMGNGPGNRGGLLPVQPQRALPPAPPGPPGGGGGRPLGGGDILSGNTEATHAGSIVPEYVAPASSTRESPAAPVVAASAPPPAPGGGEAGFRSSATPATPGMSPGTGFPGSGPSPSPVSSAPAISTPAPADYPMASAGHTPSPGAMEVDAPLAAGSAAAAAAARRADAEYAGGGSEEAEQDAGAASAAATQALHDEEALDREFNREASAEAGQSARERSTEVSTAIRDESALDREFNQEASGEAARDSRTRSAEVASAIRDQDAQIRTGDLDASAARRSETHEGRVEDQDARNTAPPPSSGPVPDEDKPI